MNGQLPILPTSVIGSYAWPGWVWAALDAERRGEFGSADLQEMLDAELRALVGAGADFIQIDEPSPAIHPDAPVDFARPLLY